MFDPRADIDAVQKILVEDAEILSLLGLSSATDLEKAKAILKRDLWDDIPGNEKRVCVYYRPSFNVHNDIISREVLEVDVHVPANEDYLAYALQAQIFKLLQRRKVNLRILHSIGQLGNIPSLPGFFGVGHRFNYYITK